MAETEKKNKMSRKVSTFNAKKKVASKIGDSKMGRKALIKLLGPEGDALVGALKSAVTKIDNKDLAKELKKDLFKWVMKASVLVQHKTLTKDNTRYLRRPAQLGMERMVEMADRNKPGDREVDKLSTEIKALGDMVRKLMEPHCQDKNANKITKLFDYYADPNFLDKLMNDQALEEERETILEATRNLLVQIPSVLTDEESLAIAVARVRLIIPEVHEPSLALCLEKNRPEFTALFTSFLDASMNKESGKAFRFLLMEDAFTQISAPNLRASRSSVIFKKFFAPGSRLSGNKPELAKIEEVIESETVSKNAFVEIRRELMVGLESDFENFLLEPIFKEYKQAREEELRELKERFGDKININP
uniref:Uncharacterized protein n=1 Tax=Mucochytrium quahogii TaxID=96639 RepID=A0A7S2WBI3_9STRA|mmetsp:Transcript_3761/g.5458  ORF Transcript_3761/g.5458 Transcript_3761/m.5458 type:complete len:362 (-) Transcript_3761:1310-2395(-)